MKIGTKIIATLTASLLLSWAPFQADAQGLPAEARNNIHSLFDQHTNVIRKVTFTKDGYVSVTESRDPKLVLVLREHVKQMRDRLQGGRMVRGWDPAFRELGEHFDDITHRVETTGNGLKITVKGKTPAAIKVVKNHAKIVSGFANYGWAEHDVRHSRVATTPKVDSPAGKGGSGKACCQAKAGDPERPDKKSCCGKAVCKNCEISPRKSQ